MSVARHEAAAAVTVVAATFNQEGGDQRVPLGAAAQGLCMLIHMLLVSFINHQPILLSSNKPTRRRTACGR
jgi:hypothetical protein